MFRRTPLALALIAATSCWGQSVISAHSGVIHLAEGQVTIDGKAVAQKLGEFGDVKTGQVLATADGRAEVLLTPGVFLRVNENSSFRMAANKLDDTKIELLTGTSMVQVSELLEDNAITLLYKGTTVSLAKKGLYRVDADQGTLRVYEGEAKVNSLAKNMVAKKGHEVQLDDQLAAKNFDGKDTDAFYRWNERRDEYISEANIYAAKSARDSGMGFNGSAAYAAGIGSWAYNPWFGMFTYMPYNGMYTSPFGYGYYSPMDVGYLYMPGSPYYYGGGYYGGSGLRGGTVGSAGAVTRNAPATAVGSGVSTARSGFNSTGGMGFGGIHGGGPAFGSAGSGSSGASAGGRMSGGGMSSGGMSSGGGMSAGGGRSAGAHR